MRFNFRVKIGNITFFATISNSQTLEGVTSLVGNSQHIVMWDMEKCNLEQAVKTLSKIQYKHRLGDIFLVSDKDQSYRGWCFSVRDWKEYLIILLETEHLDYGFFYWTVFRGKATLRISNKLNREPQNTVACLRGYEETRIPEKLEYVVYDTGVEKVGRTISLG